MTDKLARWFTQMTAADQARLAGQFDVVMHIDETRAVEPLERTAQWERGEVPETFPHAV